jgi:hypothetical protein
MPAFLDLVPAAAFLRAPRLHKLCTSTGLPRIARLGPH